MRHPLLITTVLFISFAALAAVLAGPGSGAGPDRGKVLYENNCGDCHGVSGKGDGPSARALGAPPTNFTDPKFWGKDAEKRVRTAVRDGYGAMPPLELKKEELNAVYGYMSRAFGK